MSDRDRDRHHHHRDHRGGDREWNRNGNGVGGGGHYQNRRDGGGGDYQQRDRGGDRGGGYRPQNDRHDGGYSRQNNYNNQQQRQNGQHRGGGGGYGGDQYRKRQQNDYNDGPPAKRAPIEEKPAEPMPIEIEVQGIIDGEKRRFHFKENAKFPDKVSAIHCLRVHGRIENSLPMNKKDVSMFLGQCGPLLGTGASLIMDEHKLNGLVMFKEDVVDKLVTICRSLFGNCEFLEFDEHRLNLLKLPFFTDQIHQLKVKIEGQSVLEANTEGMDALLDWLHGRNCSGKKKETNPKMLDFEAKGLPVVRQFLQRIKFDPAVAQFVVRISCPTGQLSEFETIKPEQNIQMKMAKEGNAYILRKSLIESTSADQKQPVMRKYEEYPEKLPKICIPNVPKEKVVPAK